MSNNNTHSFRISDEAYQQIVETANMFSISQGTIIENLVTFCLKHTTKKVDIDPVTQDFIIHTSMNLGINCINCNTTYKK